MSAFTKLVPLRSTTKSTKRPLLTTRMDTAGQFHLWTSLKKLLHQILAKISHKEETDDENDGGDNHDHQKGESHFLHLTRFGQLKLLVIPLFSLILVSLSPCNFLLLLLIQLFQHFGALFGSIPHRLSLLFLLLSLHFNLLLPLSFQQGAVSFKLQIIHLDGDEVVIVGKMARCSRETKVHLGREEQRLRCEALLPLSVVHRIHLDGENAIEILHLGACRVIRAANLSCMTTTDLDTSAGKTIL
mmetsp:Transcript_42434/g.109156  ORF Transcript_42434/g.109156 Transcript_42434/m.109156 type:complete len:244 (+) Transcript_42434:188-919(+)